MKFNVIDMNKWERKEHFEHYNNINPCSYSLTLNIDVTKLVSTIKNKKLKFYPVFIYIISKAVNSMKEFRMGVNEDGKLGYYNEIFPSYTIFHEDDKTFSCTTTKYNSDFKKFYKDITNDMKKYKDVKGFEVSKTPSNSFCISCIPWMNYTGFNLNVPKGLNFYAPIVTWGKYVNNNGKIEMPLTIQINHAVADGYHTSMLFREVQNICNLTYF